MGAWGPKLYEDDVALDIKNTFEKLINSGKTTENATELLIKDYEDEIADMDDEPIIWFALADTQLNLGDLLPFVKDKALEHLRSGHNLKRWEEENPKEYAVRKNVLDELELKLKSQITELKNNKVQPKKKRRIKLGDIFCIPLPNGKFAFARLFKESTIGVYKNIYTNFKELPLTEEYEFFVGVYKDVLQDGIWEIVENRPFKFDDDAWPPRRCIKDVISGEYSLYYRGEIKPSTEKDCKELEPVAVWDRHHIVDRIMGETKWNIS